MDSQLNQAAFLKRIKHFMMSSIVIFSSTVNINATIIEQFPVALHISEKHQKEHAKVKNIKIVYTNPKNSIKLVAELSDILTYLNSVYYREGANQKIHLYLYESDTLFNVNTGIMLYNNIQKSKIPIATYNLVSLGPISLMIYCAAKERYAAPYSQFHITALPAIMPAALVVVQKEQEQSQELLTHYKLTISHIYQECFDIAQMENIHKTKLEEVFNRYDRDLHLSAQEAVNLNLVHKISDNENSASFDIMITIADEKKPQP